jgi:hypothetical protein
MHFSNIIKNSIQKNRMEFLNQKLLKIFLAFLPTRAMIFYYD